MESFNTYYKAMLARDARFDGIFFIGVKTTGIYCRPICPAQPKRNNITFYPHAHAAELDGYRPCLRCRPECAPQSAAWLGTSAIVKRALRIINQSDGSHYNETSFANRFGISARHLRRLFQEELGTTPKQILDNKRLDFARQLIVETPISFTQIAFSAGFGSVRRFNDAVKNRFKRSPSELRKTKKAKTPKQIRLNLAYRPPYPWKAILFPFKNHAIAGLEKVSDNEYERVINIDNDIAHIRVNNNPEKHHLCLTISAENTSQLYSVVQKVRQMFDIDSDPQVIKNLMQQQNLLKKIYRLYPGLRIPKGWDAFEMSICTILGQLVSIQRANQLCQQLIENYGKQAKHPITKETIYLFPTAKVLTTATLDELGTTKMRKQAIRHFSQAVLKKELSLDPYQDHQTFIKNCVKIKGIGHWTAEYIALRGLGMTDAFPKEDLIIKRMLTQEKDINADLFKPWRSYLTMYLWKFHSNYSGQ